MKLAEHLKEQGISTDAFARTIGVSGEAARRYLKGERIPEPKVMVKIVLASGGEVQPNDFYAVPDLPKAQAAGGTGFATG